MRATLGLLITTLLALGIPAAANAQVIGTFSWQTQPYCNVITVAIVQQGPLYQLIGTDNLCGAGTAPVSGTAVVAGGNVVFGLTVSTPQGAAAHLSSTINVATVSGTWADGDGNTGVFGFNGAGGGGPRPAPAAATNIVVSQLSPTVYAGTGAATTVARSDHDHDARYYTKAQVDAKGSEVLITNSPSSAPVLDQAGIVRTVTTTRAGHLEAHMFFDLSATCTLGSPNWYLTIDGVALLDSAIFGQNSYIGTMHGVTAAVLAPGSHDVGYGIDCPSGGVGGFSVGTPGAASVLVVP